MVETSKKMVDEETINDKIAEGESIEEELRALFPRREGVVSLSDFMEHEGVKLLLTRSNEVLGFLGYTEHGFRHASIVAYRAWYILKKLLYDDRMCELAAISGYLHDIGNVINRHFHEMHSVFLADTTMRDLGMPINERIEVMIAIGNHDEITGEPVTPIGAAVIIADKSDVHRSRVRTPQNIYEDIHDRVNYAAIDSELEVSEKRDEITLKIEIDTEISKVMEYFEIFTERMKLCRRAAHRLGINFRININDIEIL